MTNFFKQEHVQLSQEDLTLIDLYKRTGRTLDDLPYTEEFENLHEQFVLKHGNGRSKDELFHRLTNLRKRALLPRLGRRSFGTVPRVSHEDADTLLDILFRNLPTLGQRDRLPYTPYFDIICKEFNESTGLNFSQHDIWRLVARMAK